MKLVDIKTGKLLLEYLTEFVLKEANFEAVSHIVLVQREVNTIKAMVKAGDDRRLITALSRLNKLEGGPARIQKLYKSLDNEAAKACFVKYIQ